MTSRKPPSRQLELFPNDDEWVQHLVSSLLRFGDRLRYLTDLDDAVRKKDRNKLRKLRQQPMPGPRSLTEREAEFLDIKLENPDNETRSRTTSRLPDPPRSGSNVDYGFSNARNLSPNAGFESRPLSSTDSA